MKINAFIVCLLLLCWSFAPTHGQVEEREKYAADDTFYIQSVMPHGWGNSVNAVINVKDEQGKQVMSFAAPVSLDQITQVDVRNLAAGNYVLTAIAKGSPKKVRAAFSMTDGLKVVKWEFVTQAQYNADHRKPRRHPIPAEKPVIYLYPPQEEDVSVRLDFAGKLAQTIPAYKEGWRVSARPDGSIKNYADGKIYPYLFWEGETYFQDWNMHDGFVVSADSSRQFLENILPGLGLIPKEYNEFIDYWLPRLQQHPYNLITFAGKQYEDIAPLSISPTPDAVLRVFMVYRPADKNTKARPQQFAPFVRKGFTVVEWGGMEIPESVVIK